MEQAWGYEVEFGITIAELSVSGRSLGRGYALSWYKHPRSQVS